jgi:hypothetical protein
VAAVTGFALSGAMVEGVDDQGTRTTAVTDRGYYELRAPSTGAMIVRASKEGYVSSENRVDLPRTGPVNFVLDFTPQAVALRGDYRMTLAADASCVQLPAEARTRTYDVSLTPLSADFYEGSVRNGASVVGALFAQVDSGFASFAANDSDYNVHEGLGGSASLFILFTASRAPVDALSLPVPMVGEFDYCADSPSTGCRVPRVRCSSSNHTFTLTRR